METATETSAPDAPRRFMLGGQAYEYASFQRRLGAAALDSAVWVLGIFFFPFQLPLLLIGSASETTAAVMVILYLTAWFNYYAVCEWRYGQTIGKNATGLRVLPIDGGRLSYNDSALRNLLRLVDAPLALIGADYAIVASSDRRQRLGDKLAHTIVVRRVDPDPVPAMTDRPAGPVLVIGDPSASPSPPATAATHSSAAIPVTLVPPPAPPATSWTATGGLPAPGGGEHGGWPWATWGPGQAIIGVIAALAGGLVLGVPIFIIADPGQGNDYSAVAQSLLQACQVFAMVAVPLFVATRGSVALRVGLGLLGFRRFRVSALAWILLAAFVYLVFSAFYSGFVEQPKQEDIADLFGPIPIQILLVVIGAAVSEEILFRGMLFGGLRTRMPAVPAALISGLVFGGLHATTGISAVPVLIVFGMILALLYEKTGSIWPSIILHGLNNSLALALLSSS